MQEGLKSHTSFLDHQSRAINHAMQAGWCFLQARACLGHGGWSDWCAGYKDQISGRTIRRYMLFTSRAMERVAQKNPALVEDEEELYRTTKEAVLLSPKELVEVCREVGLMRKFGEYDAMKYRQRKIEKGPAQLEFDFTLARMGLAHLCAIGEAPAELRPKRAELQQLREGLVAALRQVNSLLGEVEV